MSAAPAIAGNNAPRDVITVEGGELPRIVDEAEAALLRAETNIFQRGTMLVRPVRTEGQASDAVRRQPGAPVLVPAHSVDVRESMTAASTFLKWDARKNDYRRVDCPRDVADTYVARVGRWKLRPLTGIIEAPTLRPDGSVLERPGYDPATGFIFDPGPTSFGRTLPRDLSRATAARALQALREPLAEFPFISPADRAVCLSAVLTALVHPSLPAAPLHAFSAPEAGTGKTAAANFAARIALGRDATTVAPGKDETELEKRLAAELVKGDAIINLDNASMPLTGDLLCQLVTANEVSVRMLGLTKMVTLPATPLLLATGNNLTFTGDMPRRVVRCRMDAQTDRPDLRRFRHDLESEVRRRRVGLVRAALTIMAAYESNGSPDQGLSPLAGFDRWTRRVRSALVWLGEADPVETVEVLRSDDPGRDNLQTLLQLWHAAFGDQPVTIREAVERGEGSDPELLDALTAVAPGGRGPDRRRLGWYLRQHRDRIVAGLRLQDAGSDRTRTQTWTVSRTSAGF